MKVHVVCDKCHQSEALVARGEVDPSQVQAWTFFEIPAHSVEFTLCVECTALLVQWVFSGQSETPERSDQ